MADLTRIYIQDDGTNLKGGCVDDSFLSATFARPAGYTAGNAGSGGGTVLSDAAGPLKLAQAHRTAAH